MKTVPLHGAKAAGRVALVDDEDYELVMRYRWNVRESSRGNRRSDGPYAMAPVKHGDTQTSIFMHNLIMGCTGVDHANGYGLDNRRRNLRAATNGQNMANRRPNVNAVSAFKGVTWKKSSAKWCARVRVDGVRRNLGYFSSEEAAARAYDTAALAAFGEFARLNFPDSVDVSIRREQARVRPLVGAAKTHCIRDHEFTPENTYVRPDGGRTCRACKRLRESAAT